MLVRKSLVGVAIGLVILLAAAVWVARVPERAKVQLTQAIHTNEKGVPETGWVLLSNPSPCEVLCIPLSIQTRAPTGWGGGLHMSPTHDPFSYGFPSFPPY